MKYNPMVAPDPEQWLNSDEEEKLQAVLRYHKRARIQLPNATVHAAVHSTIENQVAMGDETPVAAKVRELMRDGLDRHDAIHAVGAVFSEFLSESMRGNLDGIEDPNALYEERVRALTARKWLDEYGDVDR
ncbi:MAG: hypothetical protein JXA93_20900 [Anaerolineae bacterium]|nr:hypothetical protein [Anaerolineae bacterium]